MSKLGRHDLVVPAPCLHGWLDPDGVPPPRQRLPLCHVTLHAMEHIGVHEAFPHHAVALLFLLIAIIKGEDTAVDRSMNHWSCSDFRRDNAAVALQESISSRSRV